MASSFRGTLKLSRKLLSQDSPWRWNRPWKVSKARKPEHYRMYGREVLSLADKTLLRHTATDCLIHPAAARAPAFWEVFSRRVAASAPLLDERTACIVARALDEHWFRMENPAYFRPKEGKEVVGYKQQKIIELLSSVFERMAQALPEQLPHYECGLSLVVMADVLSRRLVPHRTSVPVQETLFGHMATHAHRLLSETSLIESLRFIKSMANHGAADRPLCHRIARKARANVNTLDTIFDLRLVVDTFVLVNYRDTDLLSAVAQRVSHVLGGDSGTDYEGKKIPTMFTAEDVAEIFRGFKHLEVENIQLVEAVRDWSVNGVTPHTSNEDRKLLESCVGRV